MAQRVEIVLLDDTDPDGNTLADETVSFSLDGIIYEIDLHEANSAALRAALGHHITASRRIGTSDDPNSNRAAEPNMSSRHPHNPRVGAKRRPSRRRPGRSVSASTPGPSGSTLTRPPVI
jgi:hypothetical protein